MARFIRQWWTASDPSILLQTEHRLLSALVKHPFRKPGGSTQDSHGGMNLVEFRAKNSAPASASASGTTYDSRPTVVLAHGFGSGLPFFCRNIDDLLNSGKVSRVVCIDWLGMGGSARPPCWQSPIRSLFAHDSSFSFCNSKFSPSRAIDFFLDPFDRLLRDGSIFAKGQPIWLVGHSLGGYLAAKYAMRIHERQSATNPAMDPNLTRLVLASPVGFQPLPGPNDRIVPSNLPPALRLVDALWSANLTPQALVRLMGASRGQQAVKRALRGRIPHLNDASLDLLAEYLYHITVAPASGEYAMNSLLEPAHSKDGVGVYAREPLGVGAMTESISQKASSLESIKVLFGDKDWMKLHEMAARKEMQRINSSCGIKSAVQIIPQAGHHLYLDNTRDFSRHILED